MPSWYFACELGKLKPKIENPEDNTLWRLRLNLGCDVIAAVVAAPLHKHV
jgi:hypothetical protein